MNDNFRHQGLRQILVDKIRNSGFSNEVVLDAINTVPRHLFMDSSFLEFAYEDQPFSIGCNQTISQPTTVAIQTHLLDVKKNLKVLEVGTGSGYQAAVLSVLGARVYTVERHKPLYLKAKKTLSKIAPRVKCFLRDGFDGLPTFAPFDRIIITAAAPHIPEKLLEQLKVGGKMVIPLDSGNYQEMNLIEKISETEYKTTKHGFFSFVPMLENINN